ncbi:MAG: MFS transporter [Candidatus Omnitrophota bacterium]|nr:MFS transporter [Candidatus Omnitrophota bacterium]
MRAFPPVFRTLRYRNFRLFFMGQGVSLVGTWMEHVAMSWLVYRLTNSPFLLGVMGFLTQAPTFILSPFAGVMSDRWDRRRVIIITQTLYMIQAMALAFLALTGTIAVWHLIALGVFVGCVNSFDIPCRQSFIVEMVDDKEDLGNAIALNSLMFNAARLAGPSLAGVIIAMSSEGVCFLINGISFIAAIAALCFMRIKKHETKPENTHILEDLREGFSYVYGFKPIRFILLLLSVVSFTGISYVVLMPVFARDILKCGPGTFGIMMASTGLGALAATIYLAMRKSVLGLSRLIPVFSSIFSIGIIVFSVSRALWFSLSALAVAGFGIMAHMASSNIILQTIVDDDKRGRVMSFYTMAFIGVAPFGSLFSGIMASKIGATNTLIAGGSICVIASLIFARKLPVIKKAIHPIYRKMGIIPEVVSGISP